MNPRALRRRLAQVVPVVLLATFLVFGLLQLVPGDWSHIPHTPPVMSDAIAVTVR